MAIRGSIHHDGDAFCLRHAHSREEERLKLEGWVPDAVRGRLYDLGPYPGLFDLDDPSAGWALGYVRPVTRDELEGPLDEYEG